jgi:hypothetical protein
MKMARNFVICLVASLTITSALRAKDLSKYRAFSLGTNLATVLKLTGQNFADVKAVQSRPILLQELTWCPQNYPGAPDSSESAEQILFSFYNGELYKISVFYDRTLTEGLTAKDIVRPITANYGPPTTIVGAPGSPQSERSEMKQKLVAAWEDSQFSLNLVRSSFSGGFELVIYSKRLNAEAEATLAEVTRMERQEHPQTEPTCQKSESGDLQRRQQKSRESFRP